MFSLDAYEILGITNDASNEEIDRAFHKQMSVAAEMQSSFAKQKYIDDLTKAYEMIRSSSLNLPPLSEFQVEDNENTRKGWGILQSDLPIWAKGVLVGLRIILGIVCIPLLIVLLFFRICGTVAAAVVSFLAGAAGLLIVAMVLISAFQLNGIESHLTLSQYIGMSIFGGLCFAFAGIVQFAPFIIDFIGMFLGKYVYGIDLL